MDRQSSLCCRSSLRLEWLCRLTKLLGCQGRVIGVCRTSARLRAPEKNSCISVHDTHIYIHAYIPCTHFEIPPEDFWPGKAELDTVSWCMPQSQVLQLGIRYNYRMSAECLAVNGPSPVEVVVALSKFGRWRWQQQSQWWIVELASNSGCAGWSSGTAAVAVRDGVPLCPAPLSMVSPATAMPSIKDFLSAHTRQRPTEIRDVPGKCRILRVPPDQDQSQKWNFESFARPKPIPPIRDLLGKI